MWKAIVVLSSLFAIGPAFAQSTGALEPAELTESAESEPTERSYGTQILVTDGLMIAGMAGGFGTGNLELGFAGVVGLHFGSPMVHLLHGNGGKALGSLALRTLPTLAGFALAETDSDGAVVAGVLLTGLAVTFIDAGILAKEKIDPYLRYGMPTIAPTRGGATVGLVGTF